MQVSYNLTIFGGAQDELFGRTTFHIGNGWDTTEKVWRNNVEQLNHTGVQ